MVKTVLDSWWQIKRVRAGGRERWECRDASLEAAFFSMHVDPVRLECNNRFVGPLGRRKEPGNSLWLPSIYHRHIDCRWEEYIALKSRRSNSIDLISINFHLEFDIFFNGEQHKLFKEDAGVANFLHRNPPTHPSPSIPSLKICFWIFLMINTSAGITYWTAGVALAGARAAHFSLGAPRRE